jgi:hypothetical protein
MNQTLWIILIVAILAIFSFLLLFDRSAKNRRQDDRDADKADEIEKNPALLNRSQQAAELQVGEERERVQLSRFEPDAKENRRTLTTE